MSKTLFRRLFNRILALLARFLPGHKGLRPFLHRLRGVKIYGDVRIGEDVILENEFPEFIELHDGCRIALRSTLMAHFRGTGRIIVGKNVLIGPGCFISASAPNKTLTIGDGSVLAAGSVVINKDVPPLTMVGGVPAKPIAKLANPLTLNTSYEDFKKGLVPLDK